MALDAIQITDVDWTFVVSPTMKCGMLDSRISRRLVSGEPLDWISELLPATVPQISVFPEALDVDDTLDEPEERHSESEETQSFWGSVTWI
ncbi:hypothetical protein M413DRAFT_439083 [Hebeloma cylindrosporum]|uniref:Uncharacterized protein n=1 Tax=Hebeloma cylindrosporum TaxID=76867 RepID=A0A0C3CU46_HEBCY|nr:hypothetical protein M413DRAFT_439083 [Hebeloma cylindrosporum h7]